MPPLSAADRNPPPPDPVQPQPSRIARAKLTVPRQRRRALERARLQRMLAADRLPALTLVTAPAGFGKTTLAAQAVHEAPPPWRAAWLGLDAHDGGHVNFLRSMVAALRSTGTDLADATATLLDAPLPLPPRELALQFCDDLSGIDEAIVLVLDDYQLVEAAAVNEVLAALVDHMPPALRIVLLSRQVPELPLGGWRARGLLAEIGPDELRFLPDESSRFLHWTMELALPDEVLRALASQAEGWVAGLQMGALSLKLQRESGEARPPAMPASGFGGRHRFVLDYLTQQVLDGQPPEVRAFLRQTSVLHTLSPGPCEAVSGRADSRAMLARLEKANMFVSRLDDERHWYRYHPLFQEALNAELDGAELCRLHGLAAAWYESRALFQDAYRHALQADDMAACARCLMPLFDSLLGRGEVRAFEAMLSALPAAAFEQHPPLALLRAWILYMTRSARQASRFVALARLDEARCYEPALRGAMYTFRAYLALNWGDPSETESWARHALSSLPPESSYCSVLALDYLGQAQALEGRRVEALATLRQAYYLGLEVGNDSKALDALLHMVPLLIDQGRLVQARQLAGAAVDRYRDRQGRPLPVAGYAHIALGAVQLAADELDAGRESLQSGIQLCRRLELVYFVLVGQCLLARLLHAAGAPEAAWEQVSLARELAESAGGPRRRRIVDRVAVELMLRDGHADAAARLLPHAGAGPAAEADALLQARVLIAQRRGEVALRLLVPVEQAARTDGFDGSLVRIHVLQSLAHLAHQRRQPALAALERALALAASARYRRPFADEAPLLAPLLAELRTVAPEFIASLEPAPDAGLPPTLLAAAVSSSALNAREVELLQLINRGLRNREIASTLSLTIGTTKQYVNQLFGKLGARNRVEAILLGRQLKILP